VQEMQPYPLATFLGKFRTIWAKFGSILGKIWTKFLGKILPKFGHNLSKFG